MSNCFLVETPDQLNGLISSLSKEPVIACDLEASELNTKVADIEGIGLGTDKQQFFIPFPNEFSNEQIKEALEAIFKDKEVVFHNAKYDLQLLAEYDFPWPEKFQDTMIMSWLHDENSQHGLKPLAKSILGKDPKKWTDINRQIDLFTDKEKIKKDLADYCGDDVCNTFELYSYFLPLIKNAGLMADYEKIELRLIPVIARMEMRGVKINIEWLNQKRADIEKVLFDLQAKMKLCLGERLIDIHSPQQLERLLFDDLRYKPGRQTESGKRSTDNDVLEQIVFEEGLGENDFVPLLLQFRDLDKIYRTYLIALVEQADKEGVIHAHFLQHGTRTGRLASNEPNLQNIPTRSDEWNIRSAFIPREGYKFVLADYSQIELRMLAHFSQDDNMVKTFLEGGDIHKKTMELTGTERRVAKAINFGLIYGMGPRTLAHTLAIKEDDAKLYIDKFFAGYPKVRYFIERVQQNAFVHGYVEMITGRRRRFQEIKDKRWYGMIKRQAINTKIQGSAADLIKIAMIKLDKALEPLDTHMLLQIHDEVIVETPLDKVEEVKKIVAETMENALKLRVPIKVGMTEGDHWIKD